MQAWAFEVRRRTTGLLARTNPSLAVITLALAAGLGVVVLLVPSSAGATAAPSGVRGDSTAPGIHVEPGVTAALDSSQIEDLSARGSPGQTDILNPVISGPPASLAPYAIPGIPLPHGGQENIVAGAGPSLAAPNGDGRVGQCTNWAELNWVEPKGDHVYLTGYAAFQALSSAESQGMRPVNTPAPGEMVVWGPGWGYSSRYGHVAIVVAVNAQRKTFVVSEMNLIAPWEIDYRVVADADPDVLGFLPTGLKMNSQASVR